MATSPTIQELLTRDKNDAMVAGKIKYLSTAEAYDLWSKVYDTDGNFLQALDTIEMKLLLPQTVEIIKETKVVQTDKIIAVDLGCGTGRNTLQLLDAELITDVIGLELSPKMMSIAQEACQAKMSQTGKSKRLKFAVYDMIGAKSVPPPIVKDVDLVVSTLVLEHIPLDVFFTTCANMLKPGGILLMTNMHSEMGNISQAGFVDLETGDKIRPTSYAHTVEDTIEVAKKVGLEIVGRDRIKEVAIDDALAEKLGQRGKKWIGVTVWFGGIWRKSR